MNNSSYAPRRRESLAPSLIALLGVVIGAIAGGGTTWLVTNRQIAYDRENRSYDRRLALFSRFDNLSLLLMQDFLQNGTANTGRAQEFNEAMSEIGLLASPAVMKAAADVHLVIARMKTADATTLKRLLDSDSLSVARVLFNVEVRKELGRTAAEPPASPRTRSPERREEP